MSTAAIVLAAGKGTRMKSSLPKVLHPVGGSPMLFHVLRAAEAVKANPIVTVIGHEAQLVQEAVASNFPNTSVVEQTEQHGTGHAVVQAEEALKGFEGDVLILCGDVPLVDAELLERLIASHQAQQNDITFISAFIENPTGLGRVVRDEDDDVRAIVEHKDANELELKIDEINTGLYLAKAPLVFELLKQVGNKNASGEYYITDIIAIALKEGYSVGTFTAEDAESLSGINSRLQLSYAEDLYQNDMREHFMDEGVTMLDPQSVFFSWDTKVEQDVTLGANIRFGEGVTVKEGATLEGNLYIENSTVEKDASILSFSHIVGSAIGEGATVGPFARLREGTKLSEESKVGSFVETKKVTIGKGSKANHLTYLGDCEIGEGVNIGAGTVTANYHSIRKTKTQTTIESGASIGANNTLVSPVTVGKDAFTGAGTTITKDVPAGALAVSRTPQENKEGYSAKVKSQSNQTKAG